MNKIIGFCISKDRKVFKPDIFNVGLNDFLFEFNSLFIHVWGIGDIQALFSKDSFSLSFSGTHDLLDRNVIVRYFDDIISIENDWLGSIPVFYNSKDLIVSTIPNLCLTNKEIDLEGLANFFEFGYSVFNRTPFSCVKFLRYFSKIELTTLNLSVSYKGDPVLESDFLGNETTEIEVIELMKTYIGSLEKNSTENIVIPTSGGFDSRLLNYLVSEKSRIRSYTYGISKNQSNSYEVVHAKKISSIYNTHWRQILLTNFNKYISEWFSIYGISTHLHGMYQIEFYNHIISEMKFDNSIFLSGIFGDIWAGSINYESIQIPNDIINLAYNHGLSLDKDYLAFNLSGESDKKEFFERNKKLLANDKFKCILTIRLKIILISYLTQIPEYFGVPVATPFLNFEIVKAMLNISESQRKDRVWQRDFFRKVGLNLEDMDLKSSRTNNLDYEVAHRNKPEPLNVDLLSKYVEKSHLIKINRIIQNQSFLSRVKDQVLFVPKLGSLLKRIGFRNEFLIALNEYYVIKTIEIGLKYGN